VLKRPSELNGVNVHDPTVLYHLPTPQYFHQPIYIHFYPYSETNDPSRWSLIPHWSIFRHYDAITSSFALISAAAGIPLLPDELQSGSGTGVTCLH
jgi:hypothetical protein